jgi:hypothetical protein
MELGGMRLDMESGKRWKAPWNVEDDLKEMHAVLYWMIDLWN